MIRSNKPVRAEERIRIQADGTVLALSGKVEYGQGIRTGFARIVVEELSVPLEQVRVVLGETDLVPWDMGTFGSMSIATDGRALRLAAAFVRERLIDRAASMLGCPRERLSVAGGCVVGEPGRAVPFAELVGGEPIVGEVPEQVPLAAAPPPIDAPQRAEASDIVTGRARYGADVRLPGLVRGHALMPPVFGARLRSLDDRAARAAEGVLGVVRDGDFVGVVATRADQARAAVRLLRAEWDEPAPPGPAMELSLHNDPIDEAMDAAPTKLAARYTVPHIAHASIGTSAAVADVRDDQVDLYVATQRPFPLRDEAAKILGIDARCVHVHPQFASGTYGRNGGTDAAIEALRLSRAVRKPVLVEWTRTEEFRRSPHRPEVSAEVRAGIGRDGSVVAWHYDEATQPHTYGGSEMPRELIIATSGRNAVPMYRWPKRVNLQLTTARVRTGAFRSLAAAPNTFAIESFVDEVARRAGVDPIEYRLRHLDDARMRRVLEAVRERSRWTSRARIARHGYGVACAVYHGSYVAEVVEVAVESDGAVRVERVWCAVDPGRLVHPDGARNQAEGAIVQAASWTLLEQVRHDQGRVLTSSFADYPIATARATPNEIDVLLQPDTSSPSTGMGETCAVPIAGAIANAVFDACGARVRDLPITAEAVTRARNAS